MSSPEARRARLIVVSATYTTAENRKKIRALADHFDVLCVTGDRYVGYGLDNRLADQPSPEGYRLVGLPCIGPPESTTHYRLDGLTAVLRHEPTADFVLVESEPWAQVRWQTWWAARQGQPEACFGEFSWENVRRTGLKGSILKGVYRAAVRTADFVIAGNAEAGDIYREAGLAPERLLVSPQLGIDTSIFHPVEAVGKRVKRAERGLPTEAFIIGFSGRLTEEKGVRDLLTAVQTCREQVRDGAAPEIHLALLGPGPLVEELRARAAHTPWLHVHPACSHPEMAGFMQTLDLFVLPSRELNHRGRQWKEQFGHVLIEAMACGVPTVGSRSGAIPEVLGDSAAEFPPGAPSTLATLLGTLLVDTAGRRALATLQLDRVVTRYTHGQIARVWADFLRNLPSRRHPSRPGNLSGSAAVLGDYCITKRGVNRPRRFLDQFDLWEAGELKPCYAFMASSDEQLQRRLRFLRSPRARRLFNYCLGPWTILRHWVDLRRTRFLYLEGPHLFWLLVLLNRLGVFSVRDKTICCLFYRQSRFAKKIDLFNRSPTAFRPFFTCEQQIRELESNGVLPGRLRFIRWRIDADWYRPVDHPTRDFILCVGNICRDERLLQVLLDGAGLPLRLVRAGRLAGLKETYAEAIRRRPGRIEVVVNLDHQSYLKLVQNAAVVLLPIVPCDEPAGLTAALETLACTTPLLANDSLEVGALLREAGAGEPLPDLEPATWRQAIAEVLRPGSAHPARWRQTRSHIECERAIPPANRDWREFVAKASL